MSDSPKPPKRPHGYQKGEKRPGFAEGGKRPNCGRPKGKPNKVTREIRDMVAGGGITPLQYLLKIMRNHRKAEDIRIDVAKACLPYTEHRLATIEHTGKGGGPVQVQNVDLSKMTDEQLAALEPVIAALAASQDPSDSDPGGEG